MNIRVLVLISAAFVLISIPTLATSDRIHPEFDLLDRDGRRVIESHEPLSPMKTCGQCHDTEYIESHSDHVRPQRRLAHEVESPDPGSDVPFDADWLKTYGRRHVGGGPARDLGFEMNCFLCHIETVDREAMMGEMRRERFEWAVTASLGRTGLVARVGDSWIWKRDALSEQGRWPIDRIALRGPTDENCGACHGLVHRGSAPLVIPEGDPAELTMTLRTGSIFSGQRISDSGISTVNKEQTIRPWDVHAERVMRCSHCHFSLNNPAYALEIAATRPLHLRFDTRRQAFSEYLHRPSHQFARGRGSMDADPSTEPVTMRRCEMCHDAEPMHRWLPYPGLHFQKLSCEACHIPTSPMAAVREIDWTVAGEDGKGIVRYRGIEGDWGDPNAHVTGFQPVFWPRLDEDGRERLAPFNVVTTWFWTAGEPSGRVSPAIVAAVFHDGVACRPEALERFDSNHDGVLSDEELILDTRDKRDWVAARLADAGVVNPRIEGDAQPFGIHHGVMRREFALCECVSCHAAESRLYADLEVSPTAPFDAEPILRRTGGIGNAGRVVRATEGRWVARMNREGDGAPELYVPGADRNVAVNRIGIGFMAVVVFGVAVHGSARIVTGRRRRR